MQSYCASPVSRLWCCVFRRLSAAYTKVFVRMPEPAAGRDEVQETVSTSPWLSNHATPSSLILEILT